MRALRVGWRAGHVVELRAHIPRVVNPAPRAVDAGDDALADAALVRRAAAGDEEAFALLYHRYEHDAWSLASFQLRDAHDAEDAVQETFVRAYRGLGSFRGDTARPWLLAICRNVCMDRLRSRLGRPTVPLEADGVGELAAPAGDVERRLDLRAALRALPYEDAEAFLLVDVLGCRSHEAAAVVGVRAASTLRSRVDRARRGIAEALIDDLPAP